MRKRTSYFWHMSEKGKGVPLANAEPCYRALRVPTLVSNPTLRACATIKIAYRRLTGGSMSKADQQFVAMCRDILDHGTTTEGQKVRPVVA